MKAEDTQKIVVEEMMSQHRSVNHLTILTCVFPEKQRVKYGHKARLCRLRQFLTIPVSILGTYACIEQFPTLDRCSCFQFLKGNQNNARR